MKLRQIEIAGYGSRGTIRWSPGDLTVLDASEGGEASASARDLFAGFDLAARAAGYWNDFAATIDTRAVFGGGSDTMWWIVDLTAPPGELGFRYELCIGQCDDAPGWEVVFERVTRSDEFVFHELMVREGRSVEYKQRRTLAGRRPDLSAPPRSDARAMVAADMPAIATVAHLRTEPWTAPLIAALGSWMLYPVFQQTARDALAQRPLAARFDPFLTRDGSNFANVLHNACDLDAVRPSVERVIPALIPGAISLAFQRTDNGELEAYVQDAKRERQPLQQLEAASLDALRSFAHLFAPEPPALRWITQPERDVPESLFAEWAQCATVAAQRGQLIVHTASPALVSRLRDAGAAIHTPATLRVEPEAKQES